MVIEDLFLFFNLAGDDVFYESKQIEYTQL